METVGRGTHQVFKHVTASHEEEWCDLFLLS